VIRGVRQRIVQRLFSAPLPNHGSPESPSGLALPRGYPTIQKWDTTAASSVWTPRLSRATWQRGGLVMHWNCTVCGHEVDGWHAVVSSARDVAPLLRGSTVPSHVCHVRAVHEFEQLVRAVEDEHQSKGGHAPGMVSIGAQPITLLHNRSFPKRRPTPRGTVTGSKSRGVPVHKSATTARRCPALSSRRTTLKSAKRTLSGRETMRFEF
jgi:hypothetical protein